MYIASYMPEYSYTHFSSLPLLLFIGYIWASIPCGDVVRPDPPGFSYFDLVHGRD